MCAQSIGSVQDAVQLYVFWRGDEDPVQWLAHERCLAERTLITRQPIADASEKRSSSKRDRAG